MNTNTTTNNTARPATINLATLKPCAGVLFMDERGCDIRPGDAPEFVNINSYRITTHGNAINGKDGKKYFVSFSLWRDRKAARTTHKVTGKPLKNTHYDTINPAALAIDTEYTKREKNIYGFEFESSYRNIKFERGIYAHNYSYTLENVLTVINELSADHYDKIIFADVEAVEALPKIARIAGYREKEIIKHLEKVERLQADKNYLVYRYIDADNNYFEYETKSNRITG